MSAELPFQRVAVVGAGGTGSALLPLLATLPGIALVIIDGDTVEPVNLPRQPLYGPTDIGRHKAEAAAERIRRSAPDLEIHVERRFLDTANARQLIEGCSLVADCTDDLHARLLIDRTCGELGIPLVTGAVHGQQVQVATLHVPRSVDGRTTGLATLFPGRVGVDQDGCDMQRVPAHVTTLAASVMARHITALLAGDRSLEGALELIDTADGRWMRIAAPTSPFDDELIAGAMLVEGRNEQG